MTDHSMPQSFHILSLLKTWYSSSRLFNSKNGHQHLCSSEHEMGNRCETAAAGIAKGRGSESITDAPHLPQ